MMLDPEAVQQASLDDAERYAELFDGWSDDLGVAEALTLAGTIRFWAGRCALAEGDLERASAHARRAGSRTHEGEIARLLTLVISQGPEPVVEGLRRLEAMLGGGLADRKVEVGRRFQACRVGGDAGAVRTRQGAGRPREGARSRARRPGRVGPSTQRFGTGGDARGLTGDRGDGSARELRVPRSDGERGEPREHRSAPRRHRVRAGALRRSAQLSEFTERITIEGDVDAEVRWRQLRAKTLARRGRHDEAEVLARDAMRIVAPTDYLDLHADAVVRASRRCCSWPAGRGRRRGAPRGARAVSEEGEPGRGNPGRAVARGARFLTRDARSSRSRRRTYDASETAPPRSRRSSGPAALVVTPAPPPAAGWA